MAPSIESLGLYDLLAPEFLAGFTFPDHIDQYLSQLSVSGLSMTSDETGVLYTGTVYYPTGTGQNPVTQHNDPSGAVFEWSDVSFQFRLRAWREALPDLHNALQQLGGGGGAGSLAGLLNDLGDASGTDPVGTDQVGSDYPGIHFRLELLVSVLTFHLGPDWVPGVFDSSYHVVKDGTAQSPDVKILLPKMLLRYEQTEEFPQATTFTLDSWGNSGFDAPSDLAEGELVTMSPPLAMHTSGRVAFSVQDIVLDLSTSDTPPEILSHFGTGDDFEGVYIKALQFYYSDADKDFAFNISVTDALISFKGEVWLEAELDLMFDSASHPNAGGLSVTVKFLAGSQPVPFTASTQVDGQPGTYQGGTVSAPPNVAVQLQVSGGIPPYTYAVDFTPDGGTLAHLWDTSQNQAHFAPRPTADESGTLVIKVTDSTAGTPLAYTNTMSMQVTADTSNLPNGAPDDAAGGGALAPATLALDPRPAGIPDSYQLGFTPAVSGDVETLVVTGSPGPPTATENGSAVPVSTLGQVLIEVPAGGNVPFVVTFPAQGSLPGEFDLLFSYEYPPNAASVSSFSDGVPSPDDQIFRGNTVPAGVPADGASHTGAGALAYWATHALDKTQPVNIEGRASWENNPTAVTTNQNLSEWRLQVAQNILTGAHMTIGSAHATGQSVAQAAGRQSNPADRVAKVTGTPKAGQPSYELSGTLARAAKPGGGTGTGTAGQLATPPGTPPAASNSKPPSLKRLSFRVRLEKNVPVLVEISGEIDMQQQTQAALLAQPGVNGGSLGMQNTPNATANPHAGPSVVDFALNVTYDTATHNLTETITAGASPADKNGFVIVSNSPGDSGAGHVLKNIFGAVLAFAPILNAATTALDPASAGEWTDLAISLGPPVVIGGLGWINTVNVTLYGFDLVVRENVPSGLSSATFTSAALTFDYQVSFTIDVLGVITSTRTLSVRYKAFGFALDFTGTPAFKFVFDTSKGYTLDLSDPDLLHLPGALGDILKIAETRLAQYNPLTLELDLVIKADLGVVTVDEFKVKIPLDGSSAPMILPSGVHVNVPGAVIGGGHVAIQDGGFSGTFDLTIVPIGLRVAASLGIQHVTDPDDGREATAVFFSAEVDFPTPIILGDTGLGIFGLFGMFGMHYTRNLPTVPPGSAAGPDLQWLINAGGQPQNLTNLSTGSPNWSPKVGDWELGLGALLGSVDGYLLNMRGMMILELPGPEIIVTVNLQVIEDLPVSVGGIDTDSLAVGILGILDIDLGQHQITIGVSINLTVPATGGPGVTKLLVISVPISIYFNWDDPDEWHVWVGTITTPVSVNILGIVKGSGYFMIGGDAITPFPPGGNGSLPGVAVAAGFQAPVIWGSETIGIYLKVTFGADIGISFSPHLFLDGQVFLSGELRLLVVSISATGTFGLQVPPLYLNVKVCGSVSFFFFSVSACVSFSIPGGSPPSPPPPPPLIQGMYLQSYAPVIPSGQGGARPIDASLGNATQSVATGLPGLTPDSQPSGLGPVPIDTVPVIQFSYGTVTAGATSFAGSPLPACPTIANAAGGAVSLGGGRTAVYTLTDLTISPPLPPGTPVPPAVWRPGAVAGDTTSTRADLALFSRDPNLASHALERSTTLTGQTSAIWGGICTPVAPPACVLWTFCGQPRGPAHDGWLLTGIPSPDPAGTVRTSPVPTQLHVSGPDPELADGLLAVLAPLFGRSAWQPAQVIGVGGGPAGAFSARAVGEPSCLRALELPELLPVPAAVTTAGQGAGLGAGYFTADGDVTTLLAEAAAQAAAQETAARLVQLNTGAATRVQLYLAITKALVHGLRAPASAPAGQNLPDLLAATADNAVLRAAGLLSPPPPAPASAAAPAALSLAYDIVIRERDVTGTLLRESPLESLGPVEVTTTAGLPSQWTDPSGPWAAEIDQVTAFLDGALSALVKVYVEFTPLPATTVIEVAETGPAALEPPTCVIAAVGACPASEQQRYEDGLVVQQSQVSTVEGYLDGGSPVPLLVPGIAYTITATYNVTTTESDGTAGPSYQGCQQGFTFTTDAAAPPKLDPWVMSCSPANDELNVFYDDPVLVVFNDQEAIQLWHDYGYQLVLQLHAADGLNDPATSVSSTTSIAGIGPAGYDTLLNLVRSGALPCVGSVTSYQNQQYTADVKLRPVMAYTLDIVTDPAGAAPPPGAAVTPLYRTRFTTSRFASMEDLATVLGSSTVTHRHLTGPLPLASPAGGATQASDQDIESAFLAAGEQALPAPAASSITIYWIPASGGSYVPHCVLLDCTEPLWRWRQEPTLTAPDPGDPSFEIVQVAPATALEVIEDAGGGTASISGFLYSTSGTRTIAFLAPGFAPPASGTTVQLALHRPPSQAFTIADHVAPIIGLVIGPTAPWEADDV